MSAREFAYYAPASLQDAFALLADEEAKPLAGGMSLIPMMKLRLAAPAKLVDLRRIPALRSISQQDGKLHIGAMTTHYELESSPAIRSSCPLLAAAAASIGDVQVRNAGTLGGSVAHADPSADYPAALLALEASVVLASAKGEREMAFSDFLVDTFTTAIEPGELVTAIRVPVEEKGTGVHYQKHPQPASGFPMVGVAARIRLENGRIASARIGVTGLTGKAYRATVVEGRLNGAAASPEAIESAAGAVADGVTPSADIHCSADYRAHLARVATVRAIGAAVAAAQ
ncbi:MAG: xanthine dehydrogenase family protein subunit M [Bryobacterales bacterium]|nr:xanthine dehydrogenase family protein subunit M [Bryobacterales bacterium]